MLRPESLDEGSKRRRRLTRLLLWTSAVIVVLLLCFVGLLSIQDWNFARGRISSLASSILDRPVRIEGNLSAHLLSVHPTVRVEKIRVANPEWAATNERTRDFASVETLAVALNLGELFHGHLMFDTLAVDEPNVVIVGQQNGRYNFESSQQEANDKTKRELPTFPGVRQLSVRGGTLYVSDALHKLTFKGTVEASENQRPEETPFKLHGEGTLNGEAFELILSGGPLANIEMDQPYEFDAQVTAGKTHGVAKGKFERAFDFARVTTKLDIQGDNLAHLYYLTSLALPFTPPYRVSGDLKTGKRQITVNGLKGVVGKSDINGNVQVDLQGKRPKLSAQLQSHALNLADLSPAFGKGITKEGDTGKTEDSKAPKPLPPTTLLPTYEFEFDRLQAMDADVTLHADTVQMQEAPFKGVDVKVALNDSVLELNPIVFALPQGKVTGTIRIDAREKPAAEKIDLRISDVDLNQIRGKNSPPPLGGVLLARAQLEGRGNSVHDFAADADGKVTAVVPHGEIRQAFAELTGINVANGLGLLLTKNQQRATVRCAVAAFDVKDGDASVTQLVFDTDVVRIHGDGDIKLGPEALDLDIEGQPKKFRLLRLKTPIVISGTLRKPSVGVKAKDTVKQAGIAAALGAIVAPITAAIAFIDPGLAKDENCAALLADAQKEVPPPRTSKAENEDSRKNGGS